MKAIKPIRIYIDASVFGGVFDPEFKCESNRFFIEAREGYYVLVTSSVVEQKLAAAPALVRQFFMGSHADIVTPSKEALLLRDAYIKAGIISRRFLCTTPSTECMDTMKSGFIPLRR